MSTHDGGEAGVADRIEGQQGLGHAGVVDSQPSRPSDDPKPHSPDDSQLQQDELDSEDPNSAVLKPSCADSIPDSDIESENVGAVPSQPPVRPTLESLSSMHSDKTVRPYDIQDPPESPTLSSPSRASSFAPSEVTRTSTTLTDYQTEPSSPSSPTFCFAADPPLPIQMSAAGSSSSLSSRKTTIDEVLDPTPSPGSVKRSRTEYSQKSVHWPPDPVMSGLAHPSTFPRSPRDSPPLTRQDATPTHPALNPPTPPARATTPVTGLTNQLCSGLSLVGDDVFQPDMDAKVAAIATDVAVATAFVGPAAPPPPPAAISKVDVEVADYPMSDDEEDENEDDRENNQYCRFIDDDDDETPRDVPKREMFTPPGSVESSLDDPVGLSASCGDLGDTCLDKFQDDMFKVMLDHNDNADDEELERSLKALSLVFVEQASNLIVARKIQQHQQDSQQDDQRDYQHQCPTDATPGPDPAGTGTSSSGNTQPPQNNQNQNQRKQNNSNKRKYGQRKKNPDDGDDDGNGSDDGDWGGGGPPGGGGGGPIDLGPGFGCPYRKRNPLRFNIRDHLPCATQKFADLTRLKRHIRMHHKRVNMPMHMHTCMRCGERFHSAEELHNHVTLPREELCDARREPASAAEDPENGISPQIDALLTGRKNNSKIDRWGLLWRTLFPMDSEFPPEEFVPPVELDEVREAFRNEFQKAAISGAHSCCHKFIFTVIENSRTKDRNGDTPVPSSTTVTAPAPPAAPVQPAQPIAVENLQYDHEWLSQQEQEQQFPIEQFSHSMQQSMPPQPTPSYAPIQPYPSQMMRSIQPAGPLPTAIPPRSTPAFSPERAASSSPASSSPQQVGRRRNQSAPKPTTASSGLQHFPNTTMAPQPHYGMVSQGHQPQYTANTGGGSINMIWQPPLGPHQPPHQPVLNTNTATHMNGNGTNGGLNGGATTGNAQVPDPSSQLPTPQSAVQAGKRPEYPVAAAHPSSNHGKKDSGVGGLDDVVARSTGQQQLAQQPPALPHAVSSSLQSTGGPHYITQDSNLSNMSANTGITSLASSGNGGDAGTGLVDYGSYNSNGGFDAEAAILALRSPAAQSQHSQHSQGFYMSDGTTLSCVLPGSDDFSDLQMDDGNVIPDSQPQQQGLGAYNNINIPGAFPGLWNAGANGGGSNGSV